MPSLRSSLLLPLMALLLAACASAPPAPQGTPGAPAPAAAVERFMRLAQEKNYMEMGYIFGTAQGPIMSRDPAAQVERRMYGLASVLQHEAFAIRGEEPVPGRTGGAVRLTVQVTQGGRKVDVPFTAVRGPDNRWFVEQVDLEALTNKAAPRRS